MGEGDVKRKQMQKSLTMKTERCHMLNISHASCDPSCEERRKKLDSQSRVKSKYDCVKEKRS